MKLTLMILTTFAAATTTLQAQSFGLDWFTFDGGGGSSSSDAFVVSGTAGQPDAGVMSGGGYILVGGFWGLPLALPELRRLEIRQLNQVVTVSWLRPAEGFLLDETATLSGSPIPWTQVAFPYQTNATHISISLTRPTGNKFYRLRTP